MPKLYIAALLISAFALLSGCGGSNGGSHSAVLPQSSATTTHGLRVASLQPSLAILVDTSSSTQGVWLGAACGNYAAITCTDFANVERHGIGLGTVYADWHVDLANRIKNRGYDQWPSLGITPDITWDPAPDMTNFSYANVINGVYDTYITNSAQALKNYGHTIFLRPFHEFNGWWAVFSLVHQGADTQADTDFIGAWRHIHNIFHNVGANNVKFVFNFSDGALAKINIHPWSDPALAYPGDGYVDWVTFDAYNRGNTTNGLPWKSFDVLIAPAYQKAVQISSTKPIGIIELACNEFGDDGTMKADWISQMFGELSQWPSNPYPNLRLVSWYETDSPSKGYFYDSASTTIAGNAFINSIRGTYSDGTLRIRSNANVLNAMTSP